MSAPLSRKEYADWLLRSSSNGGIEILYNTLLDDAKELRKKINACKDAAKQRGCTLKRLKRT